MNEELDHLNPEQRKAVVREIIDHTWQAGLIADLAAIDPLVEVTFGQGSYGHECKFCGANDWGTTPIEHKVECVWKRAREATS